MRRLPWLLVTILAGCPKPVTIPSSPDKDAPPTLNANAQVANNSGTVDQPNTSTDATVTATANTKLILSGIANNPGGVKSVHLVLSRGGSVFYDKEVTSAPDANGLVPPSLTTFGSTDAQGRSPEFVVGTPVTATVRGANYNNQSRTINVTYVVRPTPPAVSFTTDPPDGYICVGASATLNWSITNCGGSGCTVTLEGRNGLNYNTLIMRAVVGVQGPLKVSPTDTFTKYTLIAQNAAGPTSKDRVVQLTNTCGTGATSTAGWSWYYYKATPPTDATTCSKQAFQAPDEATGKQWMQNMWPGYTITVITAQEFTAVGC